MQLSVDARCVALVLTLTATGLGCEPEEDSADAGAFGGAGGAGGGAQPDAAAGGGSLNEAGPPPTDAAMPDAFAADIASPDLGVDAGPTCPLDLLVLAIDLNLHPDGDGFRYEGDTSAAMDSTRSPCGGEGSPDVLHRFTAPRAGRWRVDTESTEPKWDTVLALRSICDDATQANCNDDAASAPLSQAGVDLEEGEMLYVVVDGHAGGPHPDRGAYVLTVTPR